MRQTPEISSMNVSPSSIPLLARTQDLRSMSEGFRSVGFDDKAFETLVVTGDHRRHLR